MSETTPNYADLTARFRSMEAVVLEYQTNLSRVSTNEAAQYLRSRAGESVRARIQNVLAATQNSREVLREEVDAQPGNEEARSCLNVAEALIESLNELNTTLHGSP